MQITAQGLLERSGEVFFLDILSHRMSETGYYVNYLTAALLLKIGSLEAK